MLCPSESDAKDLVQSTFVAAIRSQSRLARAEDPTAYIYSIMINLHRKAARSAVRERSSMDTSLIDEPEWAAHDDSSASLDRGIDLLTALSQLPLKQREVMVLRVYADLSEGVVADLLAIQRGTVKSRLSRATVALRQFLPTYKPESCYGSR